MSDTTTIPTTVIQPLIDAFRDFESEAMFGCLGSNEAGVYFPDTLRFALVHAKEGKAEFNGGGDGENEDDGERDIGSFTLGQLRALEQAFRATDGATA